MDIYKFLNSDVPNILKKFLLNTIDVDMFLDNYIDNVSKIEEKYTGYLLDIVCKYRMDSVANYFDKNKDNEKTSIYLNEPYFEHIENYLPDNINKYLRNEKYANYYSKLADYSCPGIIKINILNKFDINDLMNNFFDIASNNDIQYPSFLMASISKYKKNDLTNYITNLIETNNDYLNVLLDSYQTAEYIGHCFPKKYVYSYFKNDSFIRSDALLQMYFSYKGYLNNLILKDISNNDYECYFRSNIPSNICNYVVTKLSDDIVMNYIKSNTIPFSDLDIFYKHNNNRIIKYMLDDIRKNNNYNDYLSSRLSDEVYDSLFSYIGLNDNIFDEVMNKSSFTCVLNYLYRKRKNVLYDYLNEYIVNNDINDLINNDKLDRKIREYIIDSLPDKLIFEYLINDKLSYSSRGYVFDTRRSNIINILIDDINKNHTLLPMYIAKIRYENIFDEVLSNIKLDENDILGYINDNNYNLINTLYNYFPEPTLNVLKVQKSHNFHFFLDYYIAKFDDEVILSLLDSVTDYELFFIFDNERISKEVKNEIFNTRKDRMMSIFYNYYNKDKKSLEKMLLNSEDTLFYNEIVNTLSISDLFELMYINDKNKNDLFKTRNEEYKKYIDESFKNNKSKLFNDTLCSNRNDEVYKYIYSLYSDNDILESIYNSKNGETIIYHMNEDKNKSILYRLKQIVMVLSNEIAHNDFDKYVLLLKSFRNEKSDLFITSLHCLNLDDELLNKLYIERGLSDKQKEIIYNENKNRIIKLVNKYILEDENNALLYLQKGTNDEILDIILDHISKDKLLSLLNDEKFVNRKSIGEKFACKVLIRTYNNKEDIDTINEYLKSYNKDKVKFIISYDKIKYFLDYVGVNKDMFFQYSLNNSYDFIDDFNEIIDNDLDNFLEFKNYYVNNINKEFDILYLVHNFIRYKELCIDICNNELDNDDIKNIIMIFNRTATLDEKPLCVKDCNNVYSLIANNLTNMYSKCKCIEDYKQFIFASLFNSNIHDIKDKLFNYGNTSNLIELKYYNRNNKELCEMIDNVMLYTSMMEDILNCNDSDNLKELCESIINNLDTILVDFNYSNYDKNMKDIYALEMNSNLTKIDDNNKNMVLDIHKSMKYGVESYDFSDKKYALLTHVKSSRESIDDLVYGKSNGDMNFISLSSISHRNQGYYFGANNIIFGYDEMPLSNFVYSSTDNMGTNGSIKKNSSEVEEIKRTQRGVYEISDTTGNSEVLCLRENIKPKYIVIPNHREPSYDEINIAKKYNLKLCFTQNKNERIDSPIDIENDYSEFDAFSKDELIKMRNSLNTMNKCNNRKIGILTDTHGLLEPTIAILEDMRKNGITEIYSLGDNIGSGPNPSEVMDILDAYGVKSIKGNHELYMTEFDNYKEHLIMTDALDEEISNREWTLKHLRKDQIDKIEKYPDHIVLHICGKKVLLCHYLYDYNTGKELFNPKDYDMILQGHVHFGSKEDNIITLKGAGIGNSVGDIGMASYTIIDGMQISEKKVKYNYKNTLDDINKSDINTRKKMLKWVGDTYVRY